MATSINARNRFSRMDRPTLPSARRNRDRKPGDPPRVGVIYNPRSHHNVGADFDCIPSPHVKIAQPDERDELPRALGDLAERGIDLLVIDGGDGTVRDVLSYGEAVFRDDWPPIAILPRGKTNALAIDLGIPTSWSLQEAIDALDRGGRVRRRPIGVSTLERSGKIRGMSQLSGFVLGAGAFTSAVRAGQTAHRLGAFNGVVVATTALWAIAQLLFGRRSNPWRRGTKMRVRFEPGGAPMIHSGRGDPELRHVLFVSTLERLPARMRPFGHLRSGLKLAAVDEMSRVTATRLAAALLGLRKRNLRENGIHQLSATQFALSIEDEFILDGEAFPGGDYRIEQGRELEFVTA